MPSDSVEPNGARPAAGIMLKTKLHVFSAIFFSVGNSDPPLLWRHNEHDSVSNHQPHDCLLNRLFRRRSKKTSKPRVTGLCVGNSQFPAQMASNAENVSIWWRHHAFWPDAVILNGRSDFVKSRLTWIVDILTSSVDHGGPGLTDPQFNILSGRWSEMAFVVFIPFGWMFHSNSTHEVF